MDKLSDYICKICLIIFILICINSILGDIFFRLKYSFPKVTKLDLARIETQFNPVQKNINFTKFKKVQGEKNTYALQYMAEYSLSGLVVAKNNNFWFRDIMRNKFDDVCLIDFGIVWGEPAQDKRKLYKYWKFKSFKTLGQGRVLYWSPKGDYSKNPWPNINTYASHTHMIPATRNVMAALLKIKKNDIVKLDGYLVDIYTDKSELIARTSMSRSDTDATSRGSGACEDMYVTRVQIGNRVYE